MFIGFLLPNLHLPGLDTLFKYTITYASSSILKVANNSEKRFLDKSISKLQNSDVIAYLFTISRRYNVKLQSGSRKMYSKLLFDKWITYFELKYIFMENVPSFMSVSKLSVSRLKSVLYKLIFIIVTIPYIIELVGF